MAYHVCSIALSDKGWTNDYITTQWFKKCFLPQAKVRNSSSKMILLTYNGHKSHETIELCEVVEQHDIQLYHLPACYILLFIQPYNTDTLDCLCFLSSHFPPATYIVVLLSIQSTVLMSCMIWIWHYNMISLFVLYDINLVLWYNLVVPLVQYTSLSHSYD